MNKTFNINLGGYPFAIDEDAYDYVQVYLDTIRHHFSSSEGCDEIIYDIEVRMAELFQDHLKGRSIISMKEIDEVIMIMGKPEDFGAEPMNEPHAFTTKSSKNSYSNLGTGKRLFRDPDDKKVGGVCSGIAAYLGIEDPLWVRLIFVLFMFTGMGVITYFVLWALVPEATTSSDKLAMRGEPATIENIAKLVEEELSGLGDKINEWSKDIGGKKKSSDPNQSSGAKSFLSAGVNLIGNIVANILPFLRKIVKPLIVLVAIVMISSLAITWAALVVGMSLSSPYLMMFGPSSNLLSGLSIGAIFLIIGIPILGIMLRIAKMVFGYRTHRYVNTGLWTLWFLSIFVSSFGAMSTIKDFSKTYSSSTNTDYNISDSEIKIKMPEPEDSDDFRVQLGMFISQDDDKLAYNDVSFKIEKSSDQMLHIEKITASNGASSKAAQENAQLAVNNLEVKGNEIIMSNFVSIPSTSKYRNQSIEYIFYIPEGKTVTFDENAVYKLGESSIMSWDNIYENIQASKMVKI
ncbi:MAG: PspC domain-containing protein [Saprospiraceae bacterium]|jgi:phage shock protein PspC (stress-responsive transcriptional regulator)